MTGPNRIVLRFLRVLGHREWIRYGLRDRLVRWFCNPDTVGPIEFTAPFFGTKYTGSLNCYIDWCVHFYGAYEKQLLFLMRDMLATQSDPILLDIGANVGQHTLFMSKHCRQVHAFEPYGPVRAELERKLSRTGVSNVVVHDVALGSRNEELEFFAPIGTNTGTGSFIKSHATENNASVGTLRVVEGDAYLHSKGLQRVDLIKLDVEGFERHVLAGLAKTIQRYRPILLIEISSTTRADVAREGLTSLEALMSLLPEKYSARTVISDTSCLFLLNSARYRLADASPRLDEGTLLLFPVEFRIPEPR